MSFEKFRDALDESFTRLLAKGSLFLVDEPKARLWETYLESFSDTELTPDGSKTQRQDVNCQCCQRFIKAFGGLVHLREDGTFESWWDVVVDPYYQEAADNMRDLVITSRIREPFYAAKQKGAKEAGGYYHIHSEVPTTERRVINQNLNQFRVNRDLIKKMATYPISCYERAVELAPTVNRGEEHLESLQKGLAFRQEYEAATDKKTFILLNAHRGICGFINSAAGSFVKDLAAAAALEISVNNQRDAALIANAEESAKRMFESKIRAEVYQVVKAAPVNRQQAISFREELAPYLDFFTRRFATSKDVPFEVITWKFNPEKQAASPFDLIPVIEKRIKRERMKPIKVSLKEFIKTHLPHSEKVEVLLEPSISNNLVSLITGGEPTILKWDNPYTWSYAGGLAASSTTQKVKDAGGSVDGRLRASLAWDIQGTPGYTDLDLRCKYPGGLIFYGDKVHRTGNLNVDANGGGNRMERPVENILFKSLLNGSYEFEVINFEQRASRGDLLVEIWIDNTDCYSFTSPMLSHKGSMKLPLIKVENGKLYLVGDHKPGQGRDMELWGLPCDQFYPVHMIIPSPDNWGREEVAQYFFFIEGLNNDGPKAIIAEMIDPTIRKNHKKALELMARNLEIKPSIDQLSGVGISTSITASIIIRKDGIIYEVTN